MVVKQIKVRNVTIIPVTVSVLQGGAEVLAWYWDGAEIATVLLNDPICATADHSDFSFHNPLPEPPK